MPRLAAALVALDGGARRVEGAGDLSQLEQLEGEGVVGVEGRGRERDGGGEVVERLLMLRWTAFRARLCSTESVSRGLVAGERTNSAPLAASAPSATPRAVSILASTSLSALKSTSLPSSKTALALLAKSSASAGSPTWLRHSSLTPNSAVSTKDLSASMSDS